jgi:hypothetical protein
LLVASLLLNIVVLIPICFGLAGKLAPFDRVFGVDSTARQILLCLYLAILVASAASLLMPQLRVVFVTALLSIQVFYKLLSVVLIKDKKTPVLWFNLAIALFHTATLSSSILSPTT